MRLSNALLLAAMFVALPATKVEAQRSGIVGIVADTLGNLLSEVEVTLVDTKHSARTNSKGEFRLLKVKSGHYSLSMRRIGFAPLTMQVDVPEGEAVDLDFELTPQEVRLATIAIKAERLSPKLRRVGFESRMKTTGVPASHFITRNDIEKQNPISLMHMIDRMGGRSRSCADPNIFMDGMPMFGQVDFGLPAPIRAGQPPPRSASQNSFQKLRPLDNIALKAVDGVEVYTSTSEIPPEFRGDPDGRTNNRCVVLIWTRER